jgi:hypothetical protein
MDGSVNEILHTESGQRNSLLKTDDDYPPEADLFIPAGTAFLESVGGE